MKNPTLHSDLPQVNLKSGGLIITSEPKWVITVLGSCVAVTMFSARARLAAICHAMLPHPRPDAANSQLHSAERFRYVSHALPQMVENFLEKRIPAAEIEVKLFGGANILHADNALHQDHWVGNANVAAARQFLEDCQFSVTAENVGGTRGCKIIFNTRTGEVLHKSLHREMKLISHENLDR